jgi:hypothetical protein
MPGAAPNGSPTGQRSKGRHSPKAVWAGVQPPGASVEPGGSRHLISGEEGRKIYLVDRRGARL